MSRSGLNDFNSIIVVLRQSGAFPGIYHPVIIEHSVASLTELGGHVLLDIGADVDMVAEDLVDRMEILGINHCYPLKRGIFIGSVSPQGIPSHSFARTAMLLLDWSWSSRFPFPVLRIPLFYLVIG